MCMHADVLVGWVVTFKSRSRKCKVCRTEYKPRSSWQKLCGNADCAVAWAELEGKKAEKRTLAERKVAYRKERAEHQAKLEMSKPLPWHIKRTEKACHDYIKARDFGDPCICCGEPLDWYGDKLQINAGHYRTRAAAGHLRFNEDNIHAQRTDCNMNHAGRQAEMRVGMISKIGLERVEALDNDNRIKNWTREELLELTLYFRAKLKELRKQREGE